MSGFDYYADAPSGEQQFNGYQNGYQSYNQPMEYLAQPQMVHHQQHPSYVDPGYGQPVYGEPMAFQSGFGQQYAMNMLYHTENLFSPQGLLEHRHLINQQLTQLPAPGFPQYVIMSYQPPMGNMGYSQPPMNTGYFGPSVPPQVGYPGPVAPAFPEMQNMPQAPMGYVGYFVNGPVQQVPLGEIPKQKMGDYLTVPQFAPSSNSSTTQDALNATGAYEPQAIGQSAYPLLPATTAKNVPLSTIAEENEQIAEEAKNETKDLSVSAPLPAIVIHPPEDKDTEKAECISNVKATDGDIHTSVEIDVEPKHTVAKATEISGSLDGSVDVGSAKWRLAREVSGISKMDERNNSEDISSTSSEDEESFNTPRKDRSTTQTTPERVVAAPPLNHNDLKAKLSALSFIALDENDGAELPSVYSPFKRGDKIHFGGINELEELEETEAEVKPAEDMEIISAPVEPASMSSEVSSTASIDFAERLTKDLNINLSPMPNAPDVRINEKKVVPAVPDLIQLFTEKSSVPSSKVETVSEVNETPASKADNTPPATAGKESSLPIKKSASLFNTLKASSPAVTVNLELKKSYAGTAQAAAALKCTDVAPIKTIAKPVGATDKTTRVASAAQSPEQTSPAPGFPKVKVSPEEQMRLVRTASPPATVKAIEEYGNRMKGSAWGATKNTTIKATEEAKVFDIKPESKVEKKLEATKKPESPKKSQTPPRSASPSKQQAKNAAPKPVSKILDVVSWILIPQKRTEDEMVEICGKGLCIICFGHHMRKDCKAGKWALTNAGAAKRNAEKTGKNTATRLVANQVPHKPKATWPTLTKEAEAPAAVPPTPEQVKVGHAVHERSVDKKAPQVQEPSTASYAAKAQVGAKPKIIDMTPTKKKTAVQDQDSKVILKAVKTTDQVTGTAQPFQHPTANVSEGKTAVPAPATKPVRPPQQRNPNDVALHWRFSREEIEDLRRKATCFKCLAGKHKVKDCKATEWVKPIRPRPQTATNGQTWQQKLALPVGPKSAAVAPKN